jgi:hypothetical protein
MPRQLSQSINAILAAAVCALAFRPSRAALYLKLEVPISAINKITTATMVLTNDTPRRHLILLVFRTICVLLAVENSTGTETNLPLLPARNSC